MKKPKISPLVRAAKKKARDKAYALSHREERISYGRAYYQKNRKTIRAKQDAKVNQCANCNAPIRRESRYCINCAQLKERNHRWRGGKRINRWGYVLVRLSPHTKELHEHRLVMERELGRPLKPSEIIHHIDGNKTNNRIGNLMLFPSHLAHRNFHIRNSE